LRRRWLLEKRVPYTLHRYDALPVLVRSPPDFARALGYDVDRITKTLLLWSQRGDAYAMVVCPAQRRVDLAQLAEATGDARLELADADALREKVGYLPGGVSPMGVRQIPIFMEEDLLQHETVLVRAGLRGVEVEIDPSHLRDLTGAKMLRFVR
jgi:Cys-tRNA(Pro)/Cys-tRNA(Cys) deacylase